MVPRTLVSPAAWRRRLFGRDSAVRRRSLAVALGVAVLFGVGLVVSWLAAAAGLLPFALTFALTDAPIGREPTVANAASMLLGSAGLYGVAVGTAGYLLGVGARKVAAGRD